MWLLKQFKLVVLQDHIQNWYWLKEHNFIALLSTLLCHITSYDRFLNTRKIRNRSLFRNLSQVMLEFHIKGTLFLRRNGSFNSLLLFIKSYLVTCFREQYEQFGNDDSNGDSRVLRKKRQVFQGEKYKWKEGINYKFDSDASRRFTSFSLFLFHWYRTTS